MKKGLRRVICAALCIALLAGTLGTASAAGKKRKSEETWGIARCLSDWFYATGTIPEGMVTSASYSISLYAYDNQTGSINEAPAVHEAVFKSGGEALKDAISFEENRDGSGNLNSIVMRIDNGCLKAPGEAKFHLKFESDSLAYETDYTLRVLDWNEHPLLEKAQDHVMLNGQVGDRWLRKGLVSMAMTVHAEEIRTAMKLKLGQNVNEQDFYWVSWPGEVYEKETVKTVYEGDNAVEQVVRPGQWEANVGYEMGNVRYSLPLTLTVPGLYISAEGDAIPGSTVQMAVEGLLEGRTFTWSVEGEGAVIDEKTGALAIDPNAVLGTELKVKATGSGGEEETFSLYLNDGILNSSVTMQEISSKGFNLVHPTGGSWYSDDFYRNWYGWMIYDMSYGENEFEVDAKTYTMDGYMPGGYAEDPETAKKFLEEVIVPDNVNEDSVYEYMDIDGHPALLIIGDNYSNGVFGNHHGLIFYPRNTLLLLYRVFSIAREGQGAEDIPKVTMTDLKTLVSRFGYDPAQAPFSAANAAITLSAKGDPAGITAGKNIQFKAVFADTTKTINKKNKNDEITWTVTGADGQEVAAATVEKGNLKVDKALEEPVDLVVKASSPIYKTEAEYRLTAMPVIRAVAVEPAELTFYAGTDTPQTVKVTLDPPVSAKGVSWIPSREGIVEITASGDGEVSVKPLAAGKITIAAKEPGGRNAKVNVNVVEPVAGLTLTAKGAAKPGGTVTVAAAIEPKQAGNKAVEWSLDVGEDIAAVNAKGQVKISKEAPAGTKITVTCTALGAPEPVTATIEIEVAEK